LRIPISNQQSVNIINAEGGLVGVIIMNPTGVDVYVSDDQRQLDTVDASDLPTVGILFPANQVLPVVMTPFSGRWYARAINQAALEVVVWPVRYPKEESC
jgi:hypothetical protein